MIPGIPPELSRIILAALPEQMRVYLVGGAVRDILLNRTTHDLDFVVIGSGIQCARRTARALGAPFFPLNEAYDTGRVLFTPPAAANAADQVWKIDFAGCRGTDLEADLRARDFTINAIALDVTADGRIIDPLHGAQDLRQRVLRVCSAASLKDDPLRILRAVRFANTLNFSIDKETRRAVAEALPLLQNVAVERVRDEMLRIAGGPKPARALRLLEALGALGLLFPELKAMQGVSQPAPHVHPVWEHTLALLSKLDDLLEKFSAEFIPDDDTGYSSNLAVGLAVMRLGIFREQIHEHLNTLSGAGIPLRSLLFFAALYHDSGKPAVISRDAVGRIHFFRHEDEGERLVSQRALALHMSNAETAWMSTIVKHHMRPLQLSLEDGLPSRRAIYRFFHACGPAGVSICLMALADFLATYEYELPEKKWTHFLDVLRALLDAWWNEQGSVIAPAPYLNGDEVMQIFGIEPGPLVGDVLGKLREAQAAGEIHSREEARTFIAALLSGRGIPPPQS